MKIFAGFTTAILFFACVPSMEAQWSSNSSVNNPICAGVGTQYNQVISIDGSGGAIIAWQDARSGTYDIYAQRINSTGIVQWTANGIAICSATDIQDFPGIVSDGAGGAIIVWRDHRGGSIHDVYAQRVNGSGVVQWTADGVAICTSAGDKGFPRVVSDGSSGAIIAWSDSRNVSTAYDVYTQRINSSGTVQWTADGVLVCSANFNQGDPVIVSDGSNGAILAWGDPRSGTNNDIYTQRINSSGAVQWTANGVAICTASTDQVEPTMVSDLSHGAIIAWNDSRNAGTATDIYAQRIISTGTVSWTANGVAVSTAANNQGLPQIITDGTGGAIVVWNDFRSGSDYDVYAEEIGPTGSIGWTTNGVIVCAQASDQKNPKLVEDGNGGAIFTWQDARNGTRDIYVLLLNGGGGAEWTATGVLVSDAGNNQQNPVVATDGNGGAIITWEDYRNNTIIPDVYAARLDFNGILPVEMISFTAAATNSSVSLTWKTATETNNYGFEVERSAMVNQQSTMSNADWTKVGFVEGAGTSSHSHEYSFTDRIAQRGVAAYRLKQIDRDGSFKYTESIEVHILVPYSLTLAQNYPNPFNPTTTIEFTLPDDGRVSLKVFDVLGKVVATLVDGELKADAVHRATFDASNVSSGIYFFRLEYSASGGNAKQLMKKLLVMK